MFEVYYLDNCGYRHHVTTKSSYWEAIAEMEYWNENDLDHRQFGVYRLV